MTTGQAILVIFFSALYPPVGFILLLLFSKK